MLLVELVIGALTHSRCGPRGILRPMPVVNRGSLG